MSHSKIFRTFALAVACALSMNTNAVADAPKTVNVVAGDLVDALESLAKQCDVNVIYPSNQLREFKTQGVAGVLETRAAFQKLVQGTSFIVKEEGGSVLIMVPAKPNITATQDKGSAAPLRLAQSATSTGNGASQPQSAEGQTQSEDKKPESSQRDAENQSLQLQEVLVTGSRIARPELAVATPTTVIDSELIAARGVDNIVDLLNQFPQIGNGLNNANTDFSFGNAGLSQLNLRNLGTQRTLTIVNGMRRVGTPDDGNFLALDVGNIPTALIDRVEIQTGGSAAVYGADAVAGVVNIILKDHFDGFELSSQYGQDQHHNYETTNFSLTMGSSFEHGDAVFNITHAENSRISRAERGGDLSDLFVSNPANTGPDDGIPSSIRLKNALFSFFGIPTITTDIDGLGTVIYDSATQLFRPFHGLGNSTDQGIIDGFASIGPDGGDRAFDTRVVPLHRTTGFGRYSYNLTDDVKFFTELVFARSQATDAIGPVFDVFSTFVARDNAFISPQLQQQLDSVGADGFSLSRQHNEFGPRVAELNRQFYSLTAGFQGTLPWKNMKWNASVAQGRTNTRNTQLNDRLDANWFEAIDSVLDANGDPICRSAEARARGCVPVNIFGTGTISQAALDYVRVPAHTTETDTDQRLAQAVVTGELFDIPAGPVKFALGTEYRGDGLDFRPSFVWQNATGFFASKFSAVTADTNVKEAFTELLIPILKDKPFANTLDFEGAYRYSNYNTAGGVDTWKLGLTWSPIKDIRFRGTKALTVRAPALPELFDPGSRGAQGLDDPCDPLLLDRGSASRRANCLALGLDPVTYVPKTRSVTTLVFTTGNQQLDPEDANTLTAGLVFQPRWVPNLTITADWYDIDLEGGIARVGAQQSADNCVDLPTLDNQFCSFVTRDPTTHDLIEVKDTFINASGIRVKGVDFEVGYSFDLNRLARGSDSNWGALTTRVVGSHQITNLFIDKDLVTGAETSTESAGEFDVPSWRAVLDIAYRRGPITASWYTRWVDGTVDDPNTANPAEGLGPLFNVPSITYHSASVTYDTPWNVNLTLGLNNIFDEGPRDHPDTSTGFLAIDDVIGRFFYMRAVARFGGANR